MSYNPAASCSSPDRGPERRRPTSEKVSDVVMVLDRTARDIVEQVQRQRILGLARAADEARLRSQALLLAIDLNVEYCDVIGDVERLHVALRRLALLMSKSRIDKRTQTCVAVAAIRAEQLVALLKSWDLPLADLLEHTRLSPPQSGDLNPEVDRQRHG